MTTYLKSMAAAVVAAGLVAGSGAQAQTYPETTYKVVGTWSNLHNFQQVENPFWTTTLPEASGGKLKGDATSLNELGLKGFELMRLLSRGVFDFVHALPIYVAEDAVLEGLDLAGVARDFDQARKIAEIYKPIMVEALEKQYNAKLLNLYPWPTQMFFCNGDVAGIGDLKGKRIRVQGASQGDFVEGVGGVPVTIPFAEVVPAMQRGVVDCGITGTMPGYLARWYEVATHAFELPVGFTITFTAVSYNTWNRMNDDTKALILEQMKQFEDRAWEVNNQVDRNGIYCGTGTGPCPNGEPANMKHVVPSDADIAERERVLQEVVLKRWAERCGAECAARWNETVGQVTGLKAAM